MENRKLTYTLTRETTRRQTGFFVVVPDAGLTASEALALLKQRPRDDFLHQHLLRHLTGLTPDGMRQFLPPENHAADPVDQALEAEYLLLTRDREALEKRFSAAEVNGLINHTPLIYLRSFLEPDQTLHWRWTAFFRDNLQALTPLAPPDRNPLPPLPRPAPLSGPTVSLADLAPSSARPGHPAPGDGPPGRMADTAAERLSRAGLELGRLMRHEASLSPIGLLRTWRLKTSVDNGRNRFTLGGEQTAYGRGLSLDQARASLMMEIVERCSAFVSIGDRGLENQGNGPPPRQATYSQMVRENTAAGLGDVLDPNTLSLETTYRDEPLHWIRGETVVPDRRDQINRPIWIPAQCLFLFCNLDEPSLFSGLGSTGLAAGDTPARARLAALLEIIERHQAATMPFHLSTCFRLIVHDRQLAGLFEAYERAGVHLWFQDITPAMGVPCCRCFVVEQNGRVHMGTAAHLDARQAILAAVTENTCPFPHAPATRPAPPDLHLVADVNLPDYASGHAAIDLALLETLLIKNHYRPCYVDLTRADIGLPVVRALIPGMEMLGDFDAYSRVHPDLYRNYLSLFDSRL